VDFQEHREWVVARLRQGPLQSSTGTKAQATLGALELLMELLLAGVDETEATASRTIALARTHRDWREGMGVREVVELASSALSGVGVPEESLWVFQISQGFSPPRPVFKGHLESDVVRAGQAEAYAVMALNWLVGLAISTSSSGAWTGVGAGLGHYQMQHIWETSRAAQESRAAEPGFGEDRLASVAGLSILYNGVNGLILSGETQGNLRLAF
jgi:hypothetical protein